MTAPAPFLRMPARMRLRAAVLLLLLALAQPQAVRADDNARECDRLAIHPADAPSRAEGVQLEKVDAAKAVPACRAAVAEHPDVARSRFQLSRALFAAGLYDEARAEAQAAAAAGHATAHLMLATILTRRPGTPPNIPAAIEHIRIAAEAGIAEAQFQYAIQFKIGEGVRQSWEDAARWMRKAADQGYAPAQYDLGSMHFNGK